MGKGGEKQYPLACCHREFDDPQLRTLKELQQGGVKSGLPQYSEAHGKNNNNARCCVYCECAGPCGKTTDQEGPATAMQAPGMAGESPQMSLAGQHGIQIRRSYCHPRVRGLDCTAAGDGVREECCEGPDGRAYRRYHGSGQPFLYVWCTNLIALGWDVRYRHRHRSRPALG